jgi:hypothetical protein
MRFDDQEPETFAIVEAYYDDGATAPNSWTEGMSRPSGETREDLVSDLNMMAQALALPSLDVNGKEIVTTKRPEAELQAEAEEMTEWVDAMAANCATEFGLHSHIENIMHVTTLNPDAPQDAKDHFNGRAKDLIEKLFRQGFLEGWTACLDARGNPKHLRPNTDERG